MNYAYSLLSYDNSVAKIKVEFEYPEFVSNYLYDVLQVTDRSTHTIETFVPP